MAKASILWIIHLQARHFAQGKMYKNSLEGEFVPEFQFMYNHILSRAIHLISHAGLPKTLSTPSDKPGK